MAKRRMVDNSKEPVELQAATGNKKTHIHHLYQFEAKTEAQAHAAIAYAKNYDMLLLDGCTGTGKTFAGLNFALRDVLTQGTPYHKLVIIRSTVETREMGFQKGSLDEKLAPYELPYRSNIADMMKFNDPYPNLKAQGLVEFHSTAFLRGGTFNNAIILIDEFQNMDTDELRTALTRVGDHSRVILCGDLRQDDLFRQSGKDALQTGWYWLRALLHNMDEGLYDIIDFNEDDIVRSGLVRDIIKADNRITIEDIKAAKADYKRLREDMTS